MFNRRDLLKAFGLGAVAAATPKVLQAEMAQKAIETKWTPMSIEVTPNEINSRENNIVLVEFYTDRDRLRFVVDVGNLSYTEHMPIEFLSERGQLEMFRAEPEYMDVALDFAYSEKTGDLDVVRNAPVPEGCTLAVSYNDPAEGGLVGRPGLVHIKFPQFIWDSMEYDLAEGVVSITGRCPPATLYKG